MKIIANILNKTEGRGQSGHSTLEMLVAFGVCTLCLTGVAALTFGNQSVSVDTEKNAKAIQIARADMETVIADSRQDFQSVIGQAKQACAEDASFDCERKVITGIDGNTKNITTLVSWVLDNRSQGVSLSGLAVDAPEITALGGPDGGGNVLPASTLNNPPDLSQPGSGIWNGGQAACPQVLSISYLDTAVSIGSGSKATGLDVVNGYVYLSVMPGAGKPDFVVVRVSGLPFPAIVKSIVTGSGGLNAVDVVGNYAYAASISGSGQLQIINTVTSGITAFALPNNSGQALSIFFHGNKVYVGTENNVSGPELYVVDVTNPASPSLVESYEVGASINKVSVKANFVYMATGNTNKELVALNTDSGSQSSFDIASAMGAKSLYYSGGKVFAGSATNVSLTDVSGGSFSQLSNATLGGSLNDIAVLGTTGFLGTSNPSKYFQFWDFSSPTSPQVCDSTNNVYSLTAPVTGVVVQEDYVYLSLKDEFGPLRIIKIK